MRRFSLIAATTVLLSGCGVGDQASEAPSEARRAAPAEPRAVPAPTPERAKQAAARWSLQSSKEGTTLALVSASGGATIRLFCPRGGKRLLVNVPGFRPVGSEERLSFGSGGEVVALVADTKGDRERGGVSGTGETPADLGALVAGPISASYGAQTSGPHPAPSPDLARAFVSGCRQASGTADGKAATTVGNPCMVQGDQRLEVAPLRAVGTEPFWAARIEGRCVTYSHPEDQKGTRIWTRFTAGPKGGGRWSGALHGRRFELEARTEPRCSDGMSDKLYPFAVQLLVDGEQRRGCAEPG